MMSDPSEQPSNHVANEPAATDTQDQDDGSLDIALAGINKQACKLMDEARRPVRVRRMRQNREANNAADDGADVAWKSRLCIHKRRVAWQHFQAAICGANFSIY